MNDDKRKLMFFWPYLEWGGAQIYFLAIIKEALSEWDITVALPRQSSEEIVRFIDQTGAKIEFLDFHSVAIEARSVGQKLRRQLKRISVEIASFRFLKRYDLRDYILHIEFAPWQSWILFAALCFRGANVFTTLHNALASKPAWRVAVWKLRLQFLSRLSGFHIFASNKDTKNKLKGMVAEKFWEDIKVTYTCVNPVEIQQVIGSSPDKNEIRGKHGIDSDKFVVLCVGQFIDRKGRWVFLDAARAIRASNQDVMFVWLSPTPLTEDDQARIHDLDLGSSFRFVLSKTIGSSHEDVLRFFRVADVFALASFVEGLPIALLEAMALGLPSISTNVYAIPEALVNMETGLLIDAGDSPALANAILRLKEDTELRSRLSRQGSKYVLQNFDERVASRIAIDEYKKCFRQ